MPKYLQNAIIAVACNTSSTRQMIALIRLLFELSGRWEMQTNATTQYTLTHLHFGCCCCWQTRVQRVRDSRLCAVVQQKGQMVFKQIKQIANYSCNLSLIIGSFFILSLHISFASFSPFRFDGFYLHSWILSLCVACSILLLFFNSFVHYFPFGWGQALLAITSNKLKLPRSCTCSHDLDYSIHSPANEAVCDALWHWCVHADLLPQNNC